MQRIDVDPRTFITADTWAMLRAVDQAGVGILPIAGGMLDQTLAFVQAYEAATIDEALMSRGK